MTKVPSVGLSPDPDIAAAAVIHHLTEGKPNQRLSQLQPQTQAESERKLQNYAVLMNEAGYTEGCNMMLKGLYRRVCLQEAAYLKTLDMMAGTTNIASYRRLANTASELNNQLNATLNIIYRIKSDQRDGLDPLLVKSDFDVIDDPRPENAVCILGNAQAIAVEDGVDSTSLA